MEDCNAAFFDVMTPQRVCHLGTHVYWLAVILANLPPAIMTTLIPRVALFATFMQVCLSCSSSYSRYLDADWLHRTYTNRLTRSSKQKSYRRAELSFMKFSEQLEFQTPKRQLSVSAMKRWSYSLLVVRRPRQLSPQSCIIY